VYVGSIESDITTRVAAARERRHIPRLLRAGVGTSKACIAWVLASWPARRRL